MEHPQQGVNERSPLVTPSYFPTPEPFPLNWR
jgi:hypothetical protein